MNRKMDPEMEKINAYVAQRLAEAGLLSEEHLARLVELLQPMRERRQ